MWVFIRPGVVRSANEEKVKPGKHSCPIHRFDVNDQFLNVIDLQDFSCLAGDGWAHSPRFSAISKRSPSKSFPNQVHFACLQAEASHHCDTPEEFLLTLQESRPHHFRAVWLG